MAGGDAGGGRLAQGLLQVYTGGGKGKTTAALGLALRALGHGLKVYVIQFMKGNIPYGELRAAEPLSPRLIIRQMGRECFVNRKDPDPEDIRLAREGLELAKEVISSGEWDVVVLDELNCALDFGLLPVSEVLEILRGRPPHVEVVLTGRGAPREVIALADLVTDMAEVKHYYQKGVRSRPGIDV